MSEFPAWIELKREQIADLADAYCVREIAYCGQVSESMFFVIKPGAGYAVQNELLLSQELSSMCDETVMVVDRDKISGELANRLVKTARKM